MRINRIKERKLDIVSFYTSCVLCLKVKATGFVTYLTTYIHRTAGEIWMSEDPQDLSLSS